MSGSNLKRFPRASLKQPAKKSGGLVGLLWLADNLNDLIKLVLLRIPELGKLDTVP